MQIVIVTGLSGAGKSSVLNIFEDMGYYCMDNLPPQLLTNFVQLVQQATQPITRVAIGMDLRGGHFFEALQDTINTLEDMHAHVSILFLEASDEVLIRRYKELRRPHPLDKAGNIFDGIQRERQILQLTREAASHVLDTSDMNLGKLKAAIEDLFAEQGAPSHLLFSIVSFGYKRGIQLDADLVFDMRFLPNPFYIPELKEETGQSEAVRQFIFHFPEAAYFLDQTSQMLSYLEPYYLREGKRTLLVAFGCTGGKHRSVAMAEAMAEKLQRMGYPVSLSHRDAKYWSR